MYTLHTRFCTFCTFCYALSVLIGEISASELSRKFIKSALSVGCFHQGLPGSLRQLQVPLARDCPDQARTPLDGRVDDVLFRQVGEVKSGQVLLCH